MFFVVAVVEEEEGDGRKAAGEAEVEKVPLEARARKEGMEDIVCLRPAARRVEMEGGEGGELVKGSCWVLRVELRGKRAVAMAGAEARAEDQRWASSRVWGVREVLSVAWGGERWLGLV